MAYNATDSLLSTISGKLLEEVHLIHEPEDRLCSLRCLLKKLRPFVMEVQRRQSAEMKGLMMELTELINTANDDIKSYIITTTIRRTENISGGSNKKDVEKKAGDKLRKQIDSIMSRLKIWHKRCLTSTASSSVVGPADKDEEVVGLRNEVTMMMERVKDKDPRRDVIPIVGPGGIGKTTLALRVYNDPSIKENFPCRAWIHAYNDDELPMEKLLQEIINQIRHPSSSPSPPPSATSDVAAAAEDKDNHVEGIILDLAFQIYKHLKTSNGYLVVFDDVRRSQFWDDISMIFPNINKRGGGGGRVIFTTRYDEVALYATPRRTPFYLRTTLNREESWALFSLRVASSSSSSSRDQKWIDACGGLPLAIVALAAEHQRRKSSAPVNEEEEEDRFPKGIWELIYNNLPHLLKPCLLYLGVLNSCRLSQFKEMIIAEGFLQQPRMTTEAAAAAAAIQSQKAVLEVEDYLYELVHRNLVEVVSKRWDGGIKEIAIVKRFALMDFCRSKAKEENFLEFGAPDNFPQEANRIALQGQYGDIRALDAHLKARSLLILEGTTLPSERLFLRCFWDFLLAKLSSLRVLDLFGADKLYIIPDKIDSLINLRYLRLNSNSNPTESRDRILPPSICNLWNLQFLRVKNNVTWWFRSEIPLERSFWRMRQLKHLLCNDVLNLPQPPEDLVGGGGGRGGGGGEGRLVLDNLQRLKHVSVECCTKQVLSRMPNLVTLGVGGKIQQTHIDEISEGLPLLKRLQKLGLQGAADNGTISLPRWDMFPLSITHLTFKRTRLEGDPMRILGKLPNLQVLKLAFNAIDGGNLDVRVTDGDEFRRLRCLKLEQMGIIRWNLSTGALPILEILVIRNCTALQDLPLKALVEIQTLRQLEVYHCGQREVETAARRIQEHFGNRLELRLERSPELLGSSTLGINTAADELLEEIVVVKGGRILKDTRWI